MDFERRMATYLIENFKHSYDMDTYVLFAITYYDPESALSFVYYSRIMQAEAIATAFRVWRRNWKGKGKEG